MAGKKPEAAQPADKPEWRKQADDLLAPANMAGIALGAVVSVGEDVGAHLLNSLADKIAKVETGDIASLTGLLTAQAHVLNTVFASSLLSAKKNQAEFPHAHERYMRLAFKAQGQCRATVEAVAKIVAPAAAQQPLTIETLVQVLQQIIVSPDHAEKLFSAEQAHVQSARSPALLSQDAEGHALPVSSDSREASVLPPRRSAGKRGADR